MRDDQSAAARPALDILEVAIQPYSQRSEVLGQARRIAKDCNERGLSRVLVTTALLGDRVDIVDRILVGMKLPDFWPSHLRLALLCTENQMLPTMPFEHAASARGTPVRVFTDRAEALQWLRE